MQRLVLVEFRLRLSSAFLQQALLVLHLWCCVVLLRDAEESLHHYCVSVLAHVILNSLHAQMPHIGGRQGVSDMPRGTPAKPQRQTPGVCVCQHMCVTCQCTADPTVWVLCAPRDAAVSMLVGTGFLALSPTLCGTAFAQQQLSLNCVNPCNEAVILSMFTVYTSSGI